MLYRVAIIPLIMLLVFLSSGSGLADVNELNVPVKKEITAAHDNNETTSIIDDTNDIYTGFAKSFTEEYALLLSEFVNEEGMVNYGKLRRQRLRLKATISQLSLIDEIEYESASVDEKKVFWINAFNLQVLNIIVENYPIESKRLRRLWWPPDSIRHIPPVSMVGTPKWNRFKFIVMNEQFTLTEIENRFLRKEFGDPRVFFALTLASQDSPQLRNKPYTANKLNEQLGEQVRNSLSRSRIFKIDKKKNKVFLTVLLQPKLPWYGTEFKPKYGTDKKFKSQAEDMRAILNFLTKYISSHKKSYLETGNYKVEFRGYDWRLNDTQ